MKKVWLAFIASAVAGTAAAQSPTILYLPARDLKDQGIAVKGWGSGAISETDEVAFEGTHSVRVSTRNFFQGGLMSFSRPVDLANDFSNKENLLKLTFKLAEGSPTGGGPGRITGGDTLGGPGIRPGTGGPPGGGRGGRGAGAPGQRPGGFPGGPPGGFPGGPGPVGPIEGPMGNAGSTANVLKTLRFIVTTSDGKKSEAYVPVNVNAQGENGWLNVSVPLQAIQGFDRTNKQVTELALSGDATTTFYVGDLRIINDSTPIRGEINQTNLNLALGEEINLSGYGYGGSSILRYTWDFDDADGIQVDAEGQSVKRRFRKAGTYTITLTVSDYYNLKKPYTTTIKAVVNP